MCSADDFKEIGIVLGDRKLLIDAQNKISTQTSTSNSISSISSSSILTTSSTDPKNSTTIDDQVCPPLTMNQSNDELCYKPSDLKDKSVEDLTSKLEKLTILQTTHKRNKLSYKGFYYNVDSTQTKNIGKSSLIFKLKI